MDPVEQVTEGHRIAVVVSFEDASPEPPTDIFGTLWGDVLRHVDPAVLETTGVASIEIPAGIPSLERER